MNKKQLDLNTPLLSVRRLSSDRISYNPGTKSRATRQQSLPVNKPEPELTKPATVPFIWEQSPGQAKDDPKTNRVLQTIHIDQLPPEDVNSDATETHSVSISCSLSEQNGETDCSGPFCSDYQTRDYLMNRFLPAAKSMVVEPPQYAAKKQKVPVQVVEPPKYVKKVYSGELRPLLLEKYPVNSYHNNNNNNNKSNESDKESVVVDDDEVKKKSKKGFGFSFFIPKICTKNRVSGPKAKHHHSQFAVMDSPGPVPRLSRRTSYSGPLTPSLEKQAMDAVIKKRAESRSKEAHETQHKPSSFTRTGNSLPSSPNRGLSRSGRISPYRNESPRSPFHDGARFLGVPKEVQKPKTFPSLNVKSHFPPRLIHDGPSAVPEKTLYIDWVEKPSNSTPNEVNADPNGDRDASVLVPPLPKSPSESWLWRKMTLRSPFQKKMQQVNAVKSPVNGPKWESIVKTSNVHHGHARYSEELLSVSKYAEISF